MVQAACVDHDDHSDTETGRPEFVQRVFVYS